MKIIQLTNSNQQRIIHKVAQIIQNGGVVIYPTDTCYGIGGLNTKEIQNKIAKTKGRDSSKYFSVIVDSIKTARQIATVSKTMHKILKNHLPGAFTFVLPVKEKSSETIGIRIPNNKFCLALAKTLNVPFITTSANLSGDANPYNLGQLKKGILMSPFADLIDLVIDAGDLPVRQPSTIVSLTNNKPKVLRQGSRQLKILQPTKDKQ